MACCKAAGRLTSAVSFYLPANLRKRIEVVNYNHSFALVDNDKMFSLRSVRVQKSGQNTFLYIQKHVHYLLLFIVSLSFIVSVSCSTKFDFD